MAIDANVVMANWQKFLEFAQQVNPQFFVEFVATIDKFAQKMGDGTGIKFSTSGGVESLSYANDSGSGVSTLVPLFLSEDQVQEFKQKAAEGMITEDFWKQVRAFIAGMSFASAIL